MVVVYVPRHRAHVARLVLGTHRLTHRRGDRRAKDYKSQSKRRQASNHQIEYSEIFRAPIEPSPEEFLTNSSGGQTTDGIVPVG